MDDPPSDPPHIDITLNLDALANLIWQSFIDHVGDLWNATWNAIAPNLTTIGTTIWTPLSQWLEAGFRSSAESTWNGMFGAIPQLLYSLPPALTYNLPAYQAIAINPNTVAVAAATLAVVLLGLRTLLGAIVGRDHVAVHITGRLIPAVFAALAYPTIVVRGVTLLNQAAAAVGPQALGGLLTFPAAPNPSLVLPYMVLWLVMIYFALRLFVRMCYGLFRFLVALVFGPVALLLWAIPQTEWITSLWLRELVGWGTTPLLVVVAVSLLIPLAAGQAGFLAAAVFGIGGLMAAHDLVGLLSAARGGGGGLGTAFGLARMAGAAALSGGAGAAAIPANRITTLAEQYGYD